MRDESFSVSMQKACEDVSKSAEGAVGMAHSEKHGCVSRRPELEPQSLCKKLDVVVWTYIFSNSKMGDRERIPG